jgi:SAM-dependent methyltransferase
MNASAECLLPCPLCGTAGPIEAQRQDLALADLGRMLVGFGHCGNCGHIYQVRPPSAEILSRLYASYSNYTCFDPEAARKPPSTLTRRLLTLCQVRAPVGGTVFEVGCATGYHLLHFRAAGWNVAGCDPSPKTCAQASEIFGIDVSCGTEAELLPKQHGLSVVLFSHVLEHLPDPLSALKRARDALAPDGVALLEVPCAIEPLLMPPGWFAFEHLHYFSEATLRATVKAAGLQPVEMRISLKAELYPVIALVAVRGADPVPVRKDSVTVAQSKRFLGELVRHDNALWRATARRLEGVRGPIYVWGAGVHTAQLFDRTKLPDRTEILAIIDRDEQKWGKLQADYEIVSPDAFFSRSAVDPVVISSFAAERQIASDLENRGIAQPRIVRLYS